MQIYAPDGAREGMNLGGFVPVGSLMTRSRLGVLPRALWRNIHSGVGAGMGQGR